METGDLILAAIGLAMGGILKGAIGAGAPVIAVPILALIGGVPFAVAIFTMPNLLSNLWQGWAFRKHLISRRFVLSFAICGSVGAGFGSVLLAFLSSDVLMTVVALMVFAYIGFRLARPNWALPRDVGDKLAGPVGFLGGMLQGAGGISAPVSVTFLNALRLTRPEFIATIAVFFAGMSVTQIPALWSFGILTPERALLSLAASVPLFGAMPIGAWLARRVSREAFDKVILVLLAIIATRLLYGVFGQ